MKTQVTETEDWSKVLEATQVVVHEYEALLYACNALAQVMGFNDDYVLRRIFPKSVLDRRDTTRIVDWVNQEQATIMEQNEKRRKQRDRDQLMARLNLTNEEMSLLGITLEE